MIWTEIWRNVQLLCIKSLEPLGDTVLRAIVKVPRSFVERLQKGCPDKDAPTGLQHPIEFRGNFFGLPIVLERIKSNDRAKGLVVKRQTVRIAHDVRMPEDGVFDLHNLIELLNGSTRAQVQH